MPTLTLYDEAYSCAKAQKGTDFVRLLDENHNIVFFADSISDFTPYVLTDGDWEAPVAVVTPTVGAYAVLNGSEVVLTIPGSVKVETDLQVNFKAPCDCTAVTGLNICGVSYTVVDTLGNCVTGKGGAWASGAAVSVVLDVENKKAYRQNIASQTFTVSVPASWTEDAVNGGYYQTLAVAGILATDNPLVDVVMGADRTANDLARRAWSRIDRIVTADGSMTLYANRYVPATAFTMQVKVVR